MDISTIALLLLAPLLVWRVYRRLQGMMQRQRSILSRHYTGVLVFCACILIAAAELLRAPTLLGWLAVGTAAGIGYGIWGLKLTRFENDTCYFTPNKRLGLVIGMLFLARILYIGVEIFVNQGSGKPTPRFTEDFLNLLPLGLMAGYFGTYSAGLIRWRRALRRAINAG